jgi:hypothetical protein
MFYLDFYMMMGGVSVMATQIVNQVQTVYGKRYFNEGFWLIIR